MNLWTTTEVDISSGHKPILNLIPLIQMKGYSIGGKAADTKSHVASNIRSLVNSPRLGFGLTLHANTKKTSKLLYTVNYDLKKIGRKI